MLTSHKIVIVTGAARGIGKTIAIEFAKNGSDVVVADVDSAGLDAVVTEIEKQGRQGLAQVTDITDKAQCEHLVDIALEKFGRIDVLINNAGITRDNLFLRMDEAEWDAVITVNLKGTFNCCKAVVKPMMKQRQGRIINIASVVGMMGNAGQSNYAASKAGIIGLTKSLAKELASRQILVNAVAPGYIETEMTKNLPQNVIDTFMSIIPLKRPGTAGDVANACLFLASPLSDYITGQVMQIDGGMIM